MSALLPGEVFSENNTLDGLIQQASEKMGIPPILSSDDFGDELSTMTYLSFFRDYKAEPKKEENAGKSEEKEKTEDKKYIVKEKKETEEIGMYMAEEAANKINKPIGKRKKELPYKKDQIEKEEQEACQKENEKEDKSKNRLKKGKQRL
jgi:hypothetical protein